MIYLLVTTWIACGISNLICELRAYNPGMVLGGLRPIYFLVRWFSALVFGPFWTPFVVVWFVSECKANIEMNRILQERLKD